MEGYPREVSVQACFAHIFLPRYSLPETGQKSGWTSDMNQHLQLYTLWFKKTCWAWDCTHCSSILFSHLSNFYSFCCKMMAQSEIHIINTIFSYLMSVLFLFLLEKKKWLEDITRWIILRPFVPYQLGEHGLAETWIHSWKAWNNVPVRKQQHAGDPGDGEWCRRKKLGSRLGSEQCRGAAITAQKWIWRFISFAFTVSSRQMIPWTVNLSPVDRSSYFPHLGNSNDGLEFSVLRKFIFPGIFATFSIFIHAQASNIWKTSMEKQLSALSLTTACTFVTLLSQR